MFGFDDWRTYGLHSECLEDTVCLTSGSVKLDNLDSRTIAQTMRSMANQEILTKVLTTKFLVPLHFYYLSSAPANY